MLKLTIALSLGVLQTSLNIFHHHLTINHLNFYPLFPLDYSLHHQMNILMVLINLIYEFFLEDSESKIIIQFVVLRNHLDQTIFFSFNLKLNNFTFNVDLTFRLQIKINILFFFLFFYFHCFTF